METLVDFDGVWTPIDIVMDITGLTEPEVRSCSKVIDVEPDIPEYDIRPNIEYPTNNT